MGTNRNSSGRFNKTFMNLLRNTAGKDTNETDLDPTGDGRYRIENILGKGATSTVYRAWDKLNRRFVAIKVSKKGISSFMSEARLTGKLDHNNIVAIYDSSSDEKTSCIIMEYVEGEPLITYCSRQNLLPMSRVAEIMIEVCRGLYFAHKNGIVHRDIKPGNIMLTGQGIAKISDFGISQSDDRTQPMGFAGTPSYMSPEQLKGQPATKISDIFSLGCVLYELLEGRKAFEGENPYTIIYSVINDEPSPLTITVPIFREMFSRIIKKAMAKDPADRYRSCSDVGFDLSRVLSLLNRQMKIKKTPVLSSLSNFLKPKTLPRQV